MYHQRMKVKRVKRAINHKVMTFTGSKNTQLLKREEFYSRVRTFFRELIKEEHARLTCCLYKLTERGNSLMKHWEEMLLRMNNKENIYRH